MPKVFITDESVEVRGLRKGIRWEIPWVPRGISILDQTKIKVKRPGPVLQRSDNGRALWEDSRKER